ncbi:MAG: hypothetical protein RSN88_01685 [Gordonibacter sp.]
MSSFPEPRFSRNGKSAWKHFSPSMKRYPSCSQKPAAKAARSDLSSVKLAAARMRRAASWTSQGFNRYWKRAIEQGFARHLNLRFTRIRLEGIESGSSFNQILDKLCAHNARNQLIIRDTTDALQQGRTPLVITKRKEHAALLARELEAKGHVVFLLTGDGTPQEKKQLYSEAYLSQSSLANP